MQDLLMTLGRLRYPDCDTGIAANARPKTNCNAKGIAANAIAMPRATKLSSSLLISGSSSLSLSFLSSLSLVRALAHALGLVTSRVLEDTIDTPTGSNGVLLSLFVSLFLSVFFSFCSRAISDLQLCARGHH